ncbi:MAG: AAA family ATPase [Acidobacteria bacterium]|nr:AAA family ATPase [Acidobacteriota bacterium]
MYEQYYGFAEKPFSLTPDPKYLYRSESHANALELLQYAIGRREGFMVITGDIGTGKTTLCRALLEQIEGNTYTALLLNPFLSEEDLLKAILQDVGVLSRDHERVAARRFTTQDLISILHDFLLSILPKGGRVLVIIDEAQNLPLKILEQIRILSNLETDKEKLLQIALFGQLNLVPLLRSPDLRQLDQRVSIRYQLKPLLPAEVTAYIAHRLAIANSTRTVTFTPKALALVHQYSGGIPRLINLLCDRALLGGYAARTTRIDVNIVTRAAEGLDLAPAQPDSQSWFSRFRRVGAS